MEVEINEIWSTISSGHSYFLLLNSHFFGSSHLEVFLGEGVAPCWSAISMKLQSNFADIALRHGGFPVGLLQIFGAPFPTNTSEQLLLLFYFVI